MDNFEDLKFGRQGERKVRSSTGLVLWTASVFAILAHEILPLGDHVDRPKLIGLIVVAASAAWFSLMAHNPRTARLVEHSVIAIGWVLICLLVKWSGGAESVFVALFLFPMVYTAYFLRARGAIAQIAFGSLLAMAPLVYDPSGSAAFHFTSHLTILFSTFWGLSFAVGARKRALSRAERAARREALTDPLTGVLNLRSFRAEADAALKHAESSDRPVTIAMIDLDGLKAANAVHGHLGGDALIRAAASVLERAARSDDCVARVGGDEFAVVLRDHGASNIAAFERRLEDLVEHANSTGEAGGAQLSLSVGSAVYPDDGASVQELIAAADHRMYRVKNEVSSHSEPVVPISPAVARPEHSFEEIRDESLTPYSAAIIAAVNWVIVAGVVGLSLIVPNAHQQSKGVIVSLIGLALLTAGCTWAAARRRPVAARIFSDTVSYLAIFPAIYATGPDTPFLPLTLVPIAHAAYFLHRNEAFIRFFATVTLASGPLLLFETGHQEYAARFMTLTFASAVIAFVLQVNRSAVEQAEQRARDLSRIDPLTGVPNRRSFEEMLAVLVRQAILAENAGKPGPLPGLVFVDLDNFKLINSLLGHLGGDNVIKDAATTMADASGDGNLLFRVGGDEFAIIVSDAESEDVREVAERCRRALHNSAPSAQFEPGTATTASAGYAIWTPIDSTATALIDQADIALGNAKLSGKDKVVMFGHEAGTAQRRPALHL